MSFAVVMTFVVLLGVVVGLWWTEISPEMVLLAGLVLLLVTGVVSPAKAFEGFANEGVATIGALFVVAQGLHRTGAVNFLGMRLLGTPHSVAGAQLRVMVPVSAMSAFLNNTPVVQIMVPLVTDWARRHRISASSLLMPLSFASILGGLITLVGTSTTIVVNGLLLQQPGVRGLNMFEIAWVGIPITIAGLAYIAAVTPWLLADRTPAVEQMRDAREYTIEMLVDANSPVAGKTIEVAGLRQLPGVFLMEIWRGEDTILARPGPDTPILADDRLVFVGMVESVVDLQKIPGLTPAADQLFKISQPRSHRCLVEAVVSGSASFRNLTIRAAKFRTKFNAVVIAVARDGERVRKKIGDITLKAGDTLLLETHAGFVDTHRNSRDFLLISQVKDSTPVRHDKAWVAQAILLAMVVLVATETLSMIRASCLAGGMMIVTRCLRVSQAKQAIDWEVLLGVGAGLGIGKAMEVSGAAALVAQGLLGVMGSDPLLALILVFALTNVLASLITTKAAAVLVFPVALATAARLGVDFMPFAITLIVAAASAFATPVGYQTNVIVHSKGGYRGSDFLYVGAPLSVLVGVLTVLIVPLVWPF